MNDLVSRLLAAIQEREDLAREAKKQALTGEWVSVINAGSGDHSVQTRRGYVVVPEDGLFEVGPHIALNDPRSVLRLCQAHRKIIDNYERAKAAFDHARTFIADHNQQQATWEAWSQALRALAEGYGIGATP